MASGSDCWRLDGEAGLTRRFGDVRATFVVGSQLYPVAEGYTQSQEVSLALHRGRAWCSVPIEALDPVVVSEVCRAVDLLVSVAALAVEDGTGEMPVTVRDLGLHVVGQPAPEAPVVVHPRVRRRSRLEHLAELPLGEMARMRREAMRLALAGPMEPELPARRDKLAALPWLPYDEALLQRIANAVGALLETTAVGRG